MLERTRIGKDCYYDILEQEMIAIIAHRMLTYMHGLLAVSFRARIGKDYYCNLLGWESIAVVARRMLIYMHGLGAVFLQI